MKTVRQDYEKNFKCIADKCPDTCCSGWIIMVDDDSLKRYENYQGNIPKKVKESIDFEESCICQKEDGSCAFLNEKGLCDWILADGEDILCDTCRLYPRHVEEYEDLREWSVSLSCPEACRMFVERTDRPSFVSVEDDEPDPLEDDFEDFDLLTFEPLLEARELLFSIIRMEEFGIEAKMYITLELSKRLQSCYDEGETFKMYDVIKKFDDKAFLEELSKNARVDFSEDILFSLESLSDEWNEIIEPFKETVNLKKGAYIEGVDDKRYNLIMDNILTYFLYTYFLGSIYNGMIFGYAAMCVFGPLMIDRICRNKAYDKASFTLKDFEEIVWKYSRETEHSEENIEIFLEYFDSQCP